jgi:hypothetical protein
MMKLWQHMAMQFFLLVLQGASADLLNAPTKWKALVTLVLGAAQMTLAAYGQYFNPDGTSAKTAYIPATTAKP